jgi:hypothetical protein
MFETGTLNYVRGRLLVLDYASLRSGGDGHPSDINIPDGFTLQPAVTYSPTETTLHLVEHLASESGTYRFWSLNGRALTLVGGAPRTNPLGPWTTPGPLNVLPQQAGRGIDSGDARIGNAVFRNGHVFYAQTIGFPPGPGVGAITPQGRQSAPERREDQPDPRPLISALRYPTSSLKAGSSRIGSKSESSTASLRSCSDP